MLRVGEVEMRGSRHRKAETSGPRHGEPESLRSAGRVQTEGQGPSLGENSLLWDGPISLIPGYAVLFVLDRVQGRSC